MNTAYIEPTVPVSLTLSELISLKVDLESIRKVHTELGMKDFVRVETQVISKLADAKERYMQMLEEE